MKAAASFAATFSLLSFCLIWQAGCNPDLGLQDPLRPQADVQVVGFERSVLSPEQVQTGGTTTEVSLTGTTTTTRPNTAVVFPLSRVTVRINNGVSVLVTGYSVTYTFARPGNPVTGLALFGGPLNVFIDAAPVVSTDGLGQGFGVIGGETEQAATTVAAGFGTGRATFDVDVFSFEAQDFLINPVTLQQNPNLLVANVTFFFEDINGHTFSLSAQQTLSSKILDTTASGGSGSGATPAAQ